MSEAYWAIVSLVLGACVGSFLNVVIYRWSRDLSIRRPARSFCPACRGAIAARDNIPVLSYLLLGGRCRRCRTPISLQYPLVEIATALLFLMTYDTFFVACQRIGISGDVWLDALPLILHWALWAGLIALAVMDLECYIVDIRITWIIGAIGLIGHALWTPGTSLVDGGWIRPGMAQTGWAWGAAAGLVLVTLLLHRRNRHQASPANDEPVRREDADAPGPQPVDNAEAPDSSTAAAAPWPRLGWLVPPILLLVGYLVFMVMAGPQPPVRPPTLDDVLRHAPIADAFDPGLMRLGVGLLLCILALSLVASHPHAEADAEIVQSIEEEAPDARRNVMLELGLLSPALLLGVALVVVLLGPLSGAAWPQALLHWAPIGEWRPIWGLTTGLTGFVIGGTIGWVTRIGFTLLFGKEAMGVGDIHLMAAAGAVAGWPVVLLGFFLSALFSLAGLLVIGLRRQARAIPFGPWLGLGFLAAAMFQDRILLHLGIRLLFE